MEYLKWFKIPLFLSLFLVFPVSLYAEEIFTLLDSKHLMELSWEDCVKIARKNHPDLVSAEEKLNQAKANKAIVTSNFLPQIDSSLSEKTSKTATKDKTDTYAYEITGKQLLFDSLKTPYDLAGAKEKIKSSQFNYEVTSSNVRLRLRKAFVQLLRARELLSITEEIAQRRKQNAELVKLRYQAGREHRGSLLNAEANLAQAEFEVARAERNIKLAQRRLNKELGHLKFIPVRVKGDFEIIYSDRERPNFEDLAESNPFLQELMAQKEATRFGLKSARADFFPQVYANTSYGKTASGWPPGREAWSVGINLSLPIFAGGLRRAVVSQSRAKFNQARADERSGRDSVILTLEETWTELQDAIDKVRVQKKFLEASEERANIAQAQYSSGLILFDNWIIIEDDLVKDRKSFLDTQANSLINEAIWIQAKGGTLDD